MKKVVFFTCFFCIFVFNGVVEDIFIAIFSIGVYNLRKDFLKWDTLKSFVLGYFILNIVLILCFRLDIDIAKADIYANSKEKKVVLLVYEGEDRRYNIHESAKHIYDENKIKSFFNITYKLNKFKSMYDTFGYSSFKDKSYKFRDKLSKKLGKDYIVVNSNLYTSPYLESAMMDILNMGYKDIIVCPVLFSNGQEFEILNKRIENLQVIRYGVNIEMTDLLWQSDALAKSYKNIIIDTIKNKNEDVGVLLVGLRDKNDLEQDMLFREKIKKYISNEKGYNIKISLALLENHKKDVIQNCEKLLENGISRLCIVIPTTPFENIYVKYEAENIFNRLKMHPETKVHYLGALNDEDVFVDELYKNIKLIGS